MAQRRILAVDLDGTLHFPDSGIDPREIETLEALGRDATVRVLATGRSWHSVLKVLPASFPIDYLVFSSGSGIVEWKTQSLLVSHHLDPSHTQKAIALFLSYSLDFMVHAPLPHAHQFYFHRTEQPNADFDFRLSLHQQHGSPLNAASPQFAASQILAICPRGNPDAPFSDLSAGLPEMNVVRATSPLDGKSIWIEAFSKKASKSLGVSWVAERYGISKEDVLAVGNDYNDLDLLAWAGTAFVMDNSPSLLQQKHPTVPCDHRKGVTEAVHRWKAMWV
jgi:HAD superfamily hydrolase (TIGR01484 family)